MDNQPQKQSSSNFLFGLGLLGIFALALLILLPSLLGVEEEMPGLSSAEIDPNNSEVATVPDGFGGLQAGDVAIDFTLPDTTGKEISLSDFAGQPVLVNFWATWCAPCRIEMPHLQTAYELYKDQGLVILALDQDESAETITRYFYDEMGLTFTPLLDTNNLIAVKYGAFRINPSTYFINPDGTINYIHRGAMTAGQIDDFINDILP